MTRKETRFTNFIRSRGVGAIIAVVSAWMTWRALPSLTPSGWLGFMPELSWGVNFAVLSATAWAMIAINRQFNILRTLSVFFAAYFLFITCSTPFMSCFAGTSSVLAACMIFCMWILFTLYNEPHSNRRIFLIFAILSAGTLYDWKFLFFVPLFVIGLAQMRILRPKKIISALIGIFTPPWIVFGLDLMPIPQLPHIFFTPAYHTAAISRSPAISLHRASDDGYRFPVRQHQPSAYSRIQRTRTCLQRISCFARHLYRYSCHYKLHSTTRLYDTPQRMCGISGRTFLQGYSLATRLHTDSAALCRIYLLISMG